jgi:hypothetical protein
MATLINGNGNPRIYAAQDADLIAALAGDITGIAQIGNKFAATAVDANTISVADGVIVTKEGRRIQLDAGSTDMFVIPTGTTGVTNYYIIGYKLTTQSDDSQIAETFVQLMSSSSETITEDTFREGATDVYVSLYRVQQNGVNLGTITGLLPELTNISELKSDLANTGFTVIRSVTADGVKTWAELLDDLGYPTGAKECIETVYNNGATIFMPSQLVDTSGHHYVNTVHDTNQFKITELVVGAANARYSFVATSGGNTITDTSSAVPPSGMTISFVR